LSCINNAILTTNSAAAAAECSNKNQQMSKNSTNEENFYQKENKTLNVNLDLAEDSDEMQNNEITFDSEKFSKGKSFTT
jgi:hypothetical protein